MFRIGNGYDVHRFAEGRKLILGGVEVKHSVGLLGHSDADVLTHAIMDGILGALALGDIGKHFPDTDPKYKGISSIKLLKEVMKLIKDMGYRIGNIDSLVACEQPKLKPYIDRIRESLAQAMEVEVDRISVKATTEEKLGFTGEGLGMKSYAVVLLEKRA